MSAVWGTAPWDSVLQMQAVISYCATVDVCCMGHSHMELSTADAGCHQLLCNSWCLLYGAQPHGTGYCEVLAVIICCAVVDVCCMVRSPWDWVLQSAGCHHLLCSSWCLLYGAQPCITSAQQNGWQYQSLSSHAAVSGCVDSVGRFCALLETCIYFWRNVLSYGVAFEWLD